MANTSLLLGIGRKRLVIRHWILDWSAQMNHVALEGQVYICAACGKRSRDEYGEQALSYGWDESCVLNAVLCYDKEPDGKPYEVVQLGDDE